MMFFPVSPSLLLSKLDDHGQADYDSIKAEARQDVFDAGVSWGMAASTVCRGAFQGAQTWEYAFLYALTLQCAILEVEWHTVPTMGLLVFTTDMALKECLTPAQYATWTQWVTKFTKE